MSDNIVRDAWLQSARLHYSNLCSSARAGGKKGKKVTKLGKMFRIDGPNSGTPPSFKKKNLKSRKKS